MEEQLIKVKEIVDRILSKDDFPDRIRPDYLRDAVRSYPCRGGKRLRPALTMWCCGLLGGDIEQAAYAASAVEVYHNWTLVHDDIIDNDDFRRGEPTTHTMLSAYVEKRLNFENSQNSPSKYGRDFAILTGDIQQGWAMNLLLKSVDKGVSSDVVLSLGRRLQEFVNRDLISGEALDVEFPYRNWDDLDESEIELMLHLKTGVLLQYCAETGAMIALESPDNENADVKKLGEFAAAAGVAFQFRDDWLGVFGDTATFGKPVCADISEGKPTVLLVSALKGLNDQDNARLLEFVGRPEFSDAEVEQIRSLIRKSGAESIVSGKTEALIAEAKSVLDSFEHNNYRDLLSEWLDYLVVRDV